MSKITIGMAHHTDYNGVYFSIQDILKELYFNGRKDLFDRLEFLIIENAKDNDHAKAVKHFRNNSGLGNKFRVIDFDESTGTSSTRNKIIEEANTEFVLVMDCHVLLCPVIQTLEKLFEFIDKFPSTKNLYQGPLIYDSLHNMSTHFNDEWGGHMWGRWGHAWSCKCEENNFTVLNSENTCKFIELVSQKEITECNYCYTEFPQNLQYAGHELILKKMDMNPIGLDKDEKPFEIFSQGLGLFFTSKEHWLGFNQHCRGFGGEECYIHEKYRMNNRKCLCLPFLKWLHRFARPDGVKYELTLENKIRNYLLEFTELGLDPSPIHKEFVEISKFSEESYSNFLKEVNQIYGK